MKTLVSWSSGKDSAWMVHVLRQTPGVALGGLLTTMNAAAGRVAMHAVRETLLQQQADALELPLRLVPIPSPCPNDVYAAVMGDAVRAAVSEGFTHVAFGDLFLADIRAYREQQLAGSGLTPLFPLFGADTTSLARQMLAAGLRARLTCIDPRVLERRFVGREFDDSLLAELPATVDPCGERGEFHSFAYAGPMFRQPVSVVTGEVVERDGFVFADLLPASPVG
jgi:diphthamide synthase (EF-2-diphthine--ammonia ligase)